MHAIPVHRRPADSPYGTGGSKECVPDGLIRCVVALIKVKNEFRVLGIITRLVRTRGVIHDTCHPAYVEC